MKNKNILKDMNPTEKRVYRYINNIAAGMNKKQAARLAGYSYSYTRVPQRIEERKAYKAIAEKVYNDSSLALSKVITGVSERIDKGELKSISIKDAVEVGKSLAIIREKTMPKTMVEFDKKGDVKKASVWGVAGGAQAVPNPFAENNVDSDEDDMDEAELDAIIKKEMQDEGLDFEE